MKRVQFLVLGVSDVLEKPSKTKKNQHLELELGIVEAETLGDSGG